MDLPLDAAQPAVLNPASTSGRWNFVDKILEMQVGYLDVPARFVRTNGQDQWVITLIYPIYK